MWTSKKPLILACSLLSIFCITIMFIYHNYHNVQFHHGWKTADSPPDLPKPSIIMNGQPPADFIIALVEPDPRSHIKIKPVGQCRFVVKIQTKDLKNSNSGIPPTFVNLKVLKKPRVISIVPLKYSGRDGQSFLYSGKVEVPKRAGDYDVIVDVQYVILDSSGGGRPKSLDPVQKSIKGVILHVSS